MSAYWRRHVPPVGGGGGHRTGVRGPVPTVDSVVIGRFRGTVVVTLHGDVDLRTSAALAGALHDLIDGQGNLAVVVDLRDVPRIDPSGVEVLAGAADRIAGRGGQLRLGGPAGAVFDALALSGLARLIDIPFQPEHRPWSPPPSRAAARRTGMISHPAGKVRHDRDDSAGTP